MSAENLQDGRGADSMASASSTYTMVDPYEAGRRWRNRPESLREPDCIIDGSLPVWSCDTEGCDAAAKWVETDWYTTHKSVQTSCEEHRWRGGVVAGSHIRGTVKRLPVVLA